MSFRPHHSGRLATAVVAVASAAALAACGPSPDSPGSPGSLIGPTSAPVVSPAAPATAAGTDPVPPPLDDNGPTANPDAARISPASADQARARATAFLRAFARTDLAQQQWWDGISGFFTPDALAAYEGTAVANVPVHKISEGSAKLLLKSTKYRAKVTVKTDVGRYTVILIRADNAWLVDRSTPPKGAR